MNDGLKNTESCNRITTCSSYIELIQPTVFLRPLKNDTEILYAVIKICPTDDK